jgi:hypothetical protein
MFNELMVRLFGGASLALLLLAGLFTSARVAADPPSGHGTCIAVYGCSSSNCPAVPPCGTSHCQYIPTWDCACWCAPYTGGEQNCGCSTTNPNQGGGS